MAGPRHCLSAAFLCVAVVLVGVASATCNTTRYLELLNITVKEVTCFGGSDASVTLEPTGSDSGCTLYLYTMKKGDRQFSSKKEFKGLSAGDYELIMKFEEGVSEKITVTVGSMPEMTFTSTIEDFNELQCDECLAEATVVMSGGVGPYKFDGEVYENATFKLSWLCYGNTSFVVDDANGCQASFILEHPIPEWCLMSNESESSSSRDYWTLPEGMLPWLITVCAVVAVFLIAAFIACCAWSCVSERTLSEPKQKLLEQGNKPEPVDVSNARVHDSEEAQPEKEESDAHVLIVKEPEQKPAEESQPQAQAQEQPESEPEKHEEEGVPEANEKKKKHKKKGHKKNHKKKGASAEGAAEAEAGLVDEHALASGEEEEKEAKKSKKHKAEEEEEGPQVELDEML